MTQELEETVYKKEASSLSRNAKEGNRSTSRSWLKNEATIGFAQLKDGQTTRIQSKEEFMSLIRNEN